MKKRRFCEFDLSILLLAALLLAGCGAGAPSSEAAPPSGGIPSAAYENGPSPSEAAGAGIAATPAALMAPSILRNPEALRRYGWYDWFAQLPEGPTTPLPEADLERLWAENEWGFQWVHPLDPYRVDLETVFGSACAMITMEQYTDPDFSVDDTFPTFVLGFGQYGAGLGLDMMALDTGVYYSGDYEFTGDGQLRFTMTGSYNDPAHIPPTLVVEMRLEWPAEYDGSELIVTLLSAEGEDAAIYAPYLNAPMKFISNGHAVFGGGEEPVSSESEPAESPNSIISGYYERTQALPEGPYTPIAHTDVDEMKGDWYHFYELFESVPGNYLCNVIHYGFEDDNQIIISEGVYWSDAGTFYRGTWALNDEGLISAIICRSAHPDEPQASEFEIQFKMEWVPSEEKMAVFTLVSYENTDAYFEGTFGAFVGVPLAYIPT